MAYRLVNAPSGKTFKHMTQKNVALVLSSGGPRGWAYIGAIEALVERGYNITSIAGTSIGSMIGGIYASGHLDDVKEWLYSLDAWNVFSLMDISISKNHLVKGDKVINALQEIVPNVNIEDLNIPYTAIAADLYTGEEVIFEKGPLFDAIRASISIPSLFRPVKYGFRTLVDGGIVNTLPINRVERTEGDILVAFDVNDIDVVEIRNSIIEDDKNAKEWMAAEKALSAQTQTVFDSIKNNPSLTFMEKLKLAGSQGYKVLSHRLRSNTPEQKIEDFENSYYSILSRTFSIMNHVLAKNAAELHKPDILVKMPFDAYDDVSDYAKAREIAAAGKELMIQAINEYELL